MHTTNGIIDSFIAHIEEELPNFVNCKFIKAYEAKNLPVPIRSIYLSFAGEENKVNYFSDEDGNLLEKNDITVRVNSFIPLGISPSYGQQMLETILLSLASGNNKVTGFTVGAIAYDNDVNAYRITGMIYHSSLTPSDSR